jgi:hypothetical protein
MTKFINKEDFPMRELLLEWQKQGLTYTSTGYGKKIPTTKQIFYENKWRRVYCCIYSNVGTCYILVKGEKIIIN